MVTHGDDSIKVVDGIYDAAYVRRQRLESDMTIDELTSEQDVQHPRIIRRIHRFFNPPRLAELRDAERHRDAGGRVSDADLDVLRNPSDVKFWQVYFMIGATVAAVAAFVGTVIGAVFQG
jgi:hypothetical protein